MKTRFVPGLKVLLERFGNAPLNEPGILRLPLRRIGDRVGKCAKRQRSHQKRSQYISSSHSPSFKWPLVSRPGLGGSEKIAGIREMNERVLVEQLPLVKAILCSSFSSPVPHEDGGKRFRWTQFSCAVTYDKWQDSKALQALAKGGKCTDTVASHASSSQPPPRAL